MPTTPSSESWQLSHILYKENAQNQRHLMVQHHTLTCVASISLKSCMKKIDSAGNCIIFRGAVRFFNIFNWSRFSSEDGGIFHWPTGWLWIRDFRSLLCLNLWHVSFEICFSISLKYILIWKLQVSIVAVCGGSCGAHASRSLTEAVLLLKECGVPARAARIDALRHDLPWHYTASSYPTILVFSTRK